MAKKKIIILGAGLAGLSAAWHLQSRGRDCQVFEKEPEVGGLCRSKNIAGFIFDYDGHLLHFRHRYTFNFIQGLLGENLVKHERSAWVYSHDRFIRYPFQANLAGLPKAVMAECLLGFVQASSNNHKNKKNLNFLNWINKTFGQGIAGHFMVPYNTKFWTVPPGELTCEWLNNFIPVPSREEIIKGAIKENHRKFGYNAFFWYPKRGGIRELSLALASSIKHIYTNCPVTEINLAKKEVTIGLRDKEKFDYLISTVPLPEIPRLVRDIPPRVSSLFQRLRWNSIFNLNLGIERKEDSNGRHWVYFPGESLSFFRAGFPRNFSSSLTPKDKSSLYIEVAYSKDKPLDKSKINLRIKEDLRKTGLLKQENSICCQVINDIKYGYPIYDRNYNLARAGIIKYLSHSNIIPCGRYGSWRYFSMEESILDGKRVADCL